MALYRDSTEFGGGGYAAPRQPMARPMAPPRMPPPRPPQYPTNPQAQYGQAGYQAPRFPGYRPTSEFTADPTTANFERLMNYQIPYYMQPVQQTNYLGQSAPAYGQLMGTINNLLGQTMGGPSPGENALMSIYGSLAGGGNADAYANEYRSQLKQDPYTGAEFEAYRTQALDPIEADRTTAINRALREVSAQGIDPSSGIAQAKMNEVNRAYDANRAGAQNKLAIDANQQRQQRQGLAFQAGLSAEQLKNQAKASAASAASGAAGAWANRLGMSADLAGMGNTAAMQRAQLGYQTDAAQRAEQYQNFGTAAQLAQYMSDLPSRRQAEAMQLLNANDPSGVVSGYGGIANQYANSAQVGNQASNNIWSGIGSMWPFLQQGLQARYPQAPSGGAGGYGGYGGQTLAPPGQVAPGYGGYMPGNVQWPTF